MNQMVRDGRLARGSHSFQALFEEDAVSHFDAVTGEALDDSERTAAATVFAMTKGAKDSYVDPVTG